jgi:O-antigen ligase/tetratricopeptide (TPR) repeat protein
MKDDTEQFEEAVKKHPLLAGDETDDAELRPQLDNSEEEESEEERSSRQERSYDVAGPAWKGYVFAALPIFACLFGAGRETWSKGLITIPLALLLIIFVPKRKLPLPALIGLLGAMLAPLLSFLPAHWLSQPTAWQASLVQDWGIRLSNSLTPQAAVTLEEWLLFATCCIWLGWCLTRGFSDLQRRAMIQTLAFGGLLLCLLSILEGAHWISIPWWPRNPQNLVGAFGPFSNRNHIASLAAMTCVLCAATGHDAHRRKSRLWLPCLLGLILPITCIFMNSSRAGLILLFLGMTTWFGTIAMRRGFFQKLAISSSLIFIIATLLVMSGGNVSKRFSEAGIAEFASDNGRSSLFFNCLKMTLDAPWLGVGLGNFESFFPHYSDLPEHIRRFLHPESDLLWLLVEGGLLTLLPAMLLLLWIFSSTGPWFGKKKKHKSGMQDRRLRNAAAIVFCIGAIHGLADVPNHGLAYALLMALLAGIAIRPRRLPNAADLSQSIVFRLGGVALLALGVAWTFVALGYPVLPGSSAAEALRNRAIKLADAGSPAGALPLLDQAIEMAPMDFRYYYERAGVRLRLGQPKEDALMDFSRSRALDPTYALLCYSEGVVWLNYDPQYAVVGWREFLRRYPKPDPGDYGNYVHYQMMLFYSTQHPELREALWTLASTSEFKFEFLRTVKNKEEFERCLRSLLEQQPDLKGLEPSQRESLFSMWYQLGNQAALVSILETNRKWRDDGWRILAEHYARNSDFQRACQTSLPYLPSLVRTPPGTSTDIPALERALLYNPTDARCGIELFQAQKTQGDLDGALRTLEKVVTFQNAPPYVRQEIATLYMMKQDFRRAWESLREAMQKR